MNIWFLYDKWVTKINALGFQKDLFKLKWSEIGAGFMKKWCSRDPGCCRRLLTVMYKVLLLFSIRAPNTQPFLSLWRTQCSLCPSTTLAKLSDPWALAEVSLPPWRASDDFSAGKLRTSDNHSAALLASPLAHPHLCAAVIYDPALCLLLVRKHLGI